MILLLAAFQIIRSARAYLRSLLLAYYNDDGKLVYGVEPGRAFRMPNSDGFGDGL